MEGMGFGLVQFRVLEAVPPLPPPHPPAVRGEPRRLCLLASRLLFTFSRSRHFLTSRPEMTRSRRESSVNTPGCSSVPRDDYPGAHLLLEVDQKKKKKTPLASALEIIIFFFLPFSKFLTKATGA